MILISICLIEAGVVFARTSFLPVGILTLVKVRDFIPVEILAPRLLISLISLAHRLMFGLAIGGSCTHMRRSSMDSLVIDHQVGRSYKVELKMRSCTFPPLTIFEFVCDLLLLHLDLLLDSHSCDFQ